MSNDASLTLQRVIFTLLTNDATVASFVGARVYDRTPNPATYPLIVIGQDQVTDGMAECATDCLEIYTQIDVWSEEVGKTQAKRIMGAIKRALHEVPIADRDGFAIQEILFDNSTIVMEEDGITTHGVLFFRALVETAAT